MKKIIFILIALFIMSCEKTNNLVPTTLVNKWGILGKTSASKDATQLYRTKFVDGTKYTWSVDGGNSIANGQGSYRVEIKFSQAGTHTVSVEASGKEKGSFSVTVE